MARPMSTAERLGLVENRLVSVETRLGSVETRLESVETKVDRLEAKMDSRFDDQSRRIDVLIESFHDDFRNLYDFVQAQAVRTDTQFAEVRAEIKEMGDGLRGTIKVSYDSLDGRVSVLERRTRRSTKQQRS